MLIPLLGSLYLGWSLGANDAANIFGTAVSSRMIKFATSAILASIFVMLGAIIDGYEGGHTLSSITSQNVLTASMIAFSAALSVTIMTIKKLPVSTSQAVVGAIVGVGIMQKEVNFASLSKVVICWVGTPIGAFFIAIVIYTVFARILNRLNLNIIEHDIVLKWSLIFAGCYGAYALGANNVANVTGILPAAGIMTPFQAVALGGASIAFGIITFSKGVMSTVGKGIIKLDAFSALVVVVSEAITVHFYALIGVPVSTSQAVIGAILGIGVLKRFEALKFNAVLKITTGWLLTPLIAGIFAILTFIACHLQYVPSQ